MLRFFGYDLALTVETVVAGDGAPSLSIGRDDQGGKWLIAQVGFEPSQMAWLCAPVSARAAYAVVARQADARDAIRHSLTGTVELVVVNAGQVTPDRCLLCRDLPDELLGSIASPDCLSLAG